MYEGVKLAKNVIKNMISIVIPCYSSELFIRETVLGIQDEFNKKEYENYSYEIILVDDSSPDNTYGVIRELAKDYAEIKGISLSKNFGQHSALMAGFSCVTGEIAVCMDDDGQTPATEIIKLVSALNDDVDVVYAKYAEKKHSWHRNLGSSINAKMTEYMLDKPKDLYVSSFFASKRYVIEEVKKYSNSYPYIIGLVLRTTKRIKNVDVEHKERTVGKSGYSFRKLVALWMNGFTAFSVKPLRVADICGACLSIIGFILALVLIVKRFIIGYSAVEGWYSLITVILIVGGLNMLVLGLTGEYVGRTYLCINKSPQYVVRDKCNI